LLINAQTGKAQTVTSAFEFAGVQSSPDAPDPNDSNVVAVPYAGGKLSVLARHARMPSWNR
jgi:hypothetical protein